MEQNITEKMPAKKLSMPEQNRLKQNDKIYYHMRMRFSVSNKAGASEVTLVQTMDVIPDDDLIGKYAGAIYASLANKTGASVKFTGYDYLYAVRQTENGEKGDFGT